MAKEPTPQEQIKALEDAAFLRGCAEGEKNERAQIDTELAAAKAAGATSERERIRAVEAAGAGMPGHDKLVQEMKYDGATTGPQAAEKILAAEKASREDRLARIRSAAPEPVAAAPAPTAPASKGDYNPVEIAVKARRYQTEMAAKGIRISTIEATNTVLEQEGFKVGTEPVSAPSGN